MAGKAFPARDLNELVEILRRVDAIHPVVRLMLEFECRTGLRYVDSSQVKFSDVMINGVIKDKFEFVMSKLYQKRITQGMAPAMAKSKSTITIAINDELKAVIEDCQHINKGQKLLFASDAPRAKADSPVTNQHVNRILKKVALEMQLPYKLTTHSLRKSFAMILLSSGANIHDVQKRLGHSSLSSTEYYLNTFTDASLDHMKNISFTV
ncbi:tyrosine-type recombinase/integrase [Photobacterium leiognathi]|uniref:tyrosine-type recombinase/integrase n=1 Tax=Photobacterium leiognathi TaxID=553611 RepID=UPI002980A6E8|nr:tyrosine-type recombinase/integrase [Photobacterium leiognathi]